MLKIYAALDIRDCLDNTAPLYQQAGQVAEQYIGKAARKKSGFMGSILTVSDSPILQFDRYRFRENPVKSSLLPRVVIRISYEQLQRSRFQRLAKEWHSGTKFMSSVTDIVNHPAYISIIDMGLVALPFILDELSKKPDHWFVAIEKITGQRPYIAPEYAGNVQKLSEVWLTYGRNFCL